MQFADIQSRARTPEVLSNKILISKFNGSNGNTDVLTKGVRLMTSKAWGLQYEARGGMA